MKTVSLSKTSLSKVLLPVAFAGLLLTPNSAPAQNAPCCPETNGVKFIALPWVNGGMDVKDSRQSIVLADDFFCNTPGPITDIHIWGSWLNDFHGTITNFWLGIYNDVPANPNGPGGPTPSHPGTDLLWSQSFPTNQFCEIAVGPSSETFYNPTNQVTIGSDYTVYYYCFYPTNPFFQQGQPNSPTNYWLAARAQLAQDGSLYGWKTSTCNYNDAAVWGTVGANGLPSGDWQPMTNSQTLLPINLAFKITTAVQPIPCVETNGVKYDQEPNLFNGGYDVWDSSSRPVQATDGPWWLADDFKCTTTGPITDIHLWGSWQNDSPLSNSITFQLYVFDDVPTNAVNPYSHPGTNVLWHQTFIPGSYAESVWYPYAYESFLDPGLPQNPLGPDHTVWYYCFYPTNLYQYGTAAQPTNYWLAAFAELPSCVTNVFGWKTTTNVQHDISVHAPWFGYNVPPPNNAWQPNFDGSGLPFDLAFKLTTRTNQCPLPVIQCSNQVIECGTAWAITPPPVLDQCCPTPIPPATLAATPVTNGTACSQVITMVWQYTDCLGRTVSCLETVTVQDTTPPALFCTNLVLACGDHSYTNPPAAYDACCGANVTVKLQSSQIVNSNCAGQTISQLWQATDCCSNSSECIRIVNIVAGLGNNLVVPNTNASVEGNFGNTYPFDIGAESISTMRYQQVYASSQFGAVPPGGAYITAIAFRVDAGVGAFAATLPSVQINLSTTAKLPDSLSTTFANNVGLDDTVVYNGSLPLSSAASGSPAAFDIVIPLTTPFWYVPAAGDLLLDVRNFGGGFSAQFDAVNTTGDSVSRVYGAVGNAIGSTDSGGLVTEFTLGVNTISLNCPSNIVVCTCSNIPVLVSWPTNVAIDYCTSVTVTSVPPSPALFLPDTTNTVVLSAHDACGNSNGCSFTVAVVRPVLGSISVIRTAPNTIQLMWSSCGILQVTTNLTNGLTPFVDLPGATSPYTVSTVAPPVTRYYRLRCLSP